MLASLNTGDCYHVSFAFLEPCFSLKRQLQAEQNETVYAQQQYLHV